MTPALLLLSLRMALSGLFTVPVTREDAKIIIKDGSSGGINSTNKVVVTYEDKVIELKMQTDYSLNTEIEYVGKIAYLERSEYIVWYQFE